MEFSKIGAWLRRNVRKALTSRSEELSAKNGTNKSHKGRHTPNGERKLKQLPPRRSRFRTRSTQIGQRLFRHLVPRQPHRWRVRNSAISVTKASLGLSRRGIVPPLLSIDPQVVHATLENDWTGSERSRPPFSDFSTKTCTKAEALWRNHRKPQSPKP